MAAVERMMKIQEVILRALAGGAAFETVLIFRVAAPSWYSKGRRF
jgi:hypothetical protein